MGSVYKIRYSFLVMKTRLLILLALMAFHGCGIFSPREDFEEPQGQTVDPYNFDGILSSLGEHFVSTNPVELFDMSMIYIDFNTGPERKFNKNQLVNNFRNLLEQKYDFSVTWSDSTADYQDIGDSLFISKVRYQIIYKQKNGDSTVTEYGSSDFILKGKPAWKICYWADIPDRVGRPSFFAPIGTE